MDESHCRLVSSRGLLKSCDLHSLNPISSYGRLNDYPTTTVKPGHSFYVCLTALPQVLPILDQLPCAIVLVSGDADETVAGTPEVRAILQHPKLLAWWSQNCIYDHAKLRRLPIGLDYHTMTRSDCWGPLLSCQDQERLLLGIKAAAKALPDRIVKCYSNFHHTATTRAIKFASDRIAAVQEVPAELVVAETTQVARAISWANQSRYAFVLSPHGNGLDCHRTWEGLALGCIVIVRKSGLDSLYADLPVLIVAEWSDISAELLQQTLKDFSQRSFNYAKLELAYWLNLIKADGKVYQ